MLVLTDETGEFESTKKSLAFVTLVTVNKEFINKLERWLLREFGSINLPKGINLELEARTKIINFIASRSGLFYTTIAYDLTNSTQQVIKDHQDAYVSKIETAIENLKKSGGYQSMVHDISLFRNQFRKLSKADYIKFIMFYECYILWLQYFTFDVVKLNKNQDSWQFKHLIDTQNKPNTFARLLIGILKFTFRTENNLKLNTPYELQDKSHPFNRVNRDEEGYAHPNNYMADISVSSEDVHNLLNLPDIIGNTFLRSTKSYEDSYYQLARKIAQRRSTAVAMKGRNSQWGYSYPFVINAISTKSRRTDKSFDVYWEKVRL